MAGTASRADHTTPDERPENPSKLAAAQRRIVGWLRSAAVSLITALAFPAVQRGLIGCSLMAFGAFTPAFLPRDNPLWHHPLADIAQHWPGKALWTASLLVGVALLLDAWLRLRPVADGKPAPDHRAVLALWTIPLLPLPPLFSNDAYSYAAQGWMVHLGLSPYDHGPTAAPGQFTSQVDIYWKSTPAPYGPLGLEIQRWVVVACDFAPFPSAVAMRVPALLALVALVLVVPKLARQLGGSPNTALWAATLNPMVLMHVVGGSHNDSLMVTLMVTGAYLALRGKLLLGCVAIGLAAAVKQPAILMLAPLAAIAAARGRTDWDAPYQSRRSELRYQPRIIGYAMGVLVIIVATFAAVTAITGLGYGWLRALTVPGEVRTPLSPATWITGALEYSFAAIGNPAAAAGIISVVRTVVMLTGLGVLVALWLRFGRTEPVRFAGWALITMAVSGPAMHSWYLLWGGTLLMCCPFSYRTLRLVMWASALMVSYSAVDASFRNGAVAMGVTALAAVIWVATGHDRDLLRIPLRKSRTPAAAPSSASDGAH